MTLPPYSYWPIVGRPEVRWPDGRGMAFYIGLNVEHFRPGVPATAITNALGLAIDPMNQGWRDYGLRVGIWRMMELLDECGLRASVLVNSEVCRRYPQIMEAGTARNWAWLGHGITNSEMWAGHEPAEEAALLDGVVEEIRRSTGRRPRGWLGPGFSETASTLRLLGERGFTYSLDWACDDQPYPLEVAGHRIASVPYSSEINDICAMLVWNWTPQQFQDAVIAQFDRLYAESKRRPGVVMGLSLHPFLSNTPFRHGYLEKALAHIRAHDDVWFPTTDEIATHYLDHHYDEAVAAIGAGGGMQRNVADAAGVYPSPKR